MPENHGWTHGEDGIDPIPGMGGGSSGSANASIIYLPLLNANRDVGDVDSAPAGFDFAINSSYPHNGYMGASANLSSMSWLVDIGPQWSAWKILVSGERGPDFGKLDVYIASAPSSSFYPGEAFPVGLGDTTPVLVETIDFYNAANSILWTQLAQGFQITGAEGTDGTAFTTGTGSHTGLNLWDGGPGPHHIKLYVNGQNASSSGFKVRIYEACLIRLSDVFAG